MGSTVVVLFVTAVQMGDMIVLGRVYAALIVLNSVSVDRRFVGGQTDWIEHFAHVVPHMNAVMVLVGRCYWQRCSYIGNWGKEGPLVQAKHHTVDIEAHYCMKNT